MLNEQPKFNLIANTLEEVRDEIPKKITKKANQAA